MLAGIYRVAVPYDGSPRPPALPGAILAVALNAALGWAYGWYVTRDRSASAYAAGLAVVGATLITLWLLSLAVLLGAEFNRILAERLRATEQWQRSGASSSQRTSRKLPTELSRGRSIWHRSSARP
jgi:uncharacterized BrkB/YihY/UPF0761 family membrane protein